MQAIDDAAAEVTNKGKEVEDGNCIGFAQAPLGKHTDQIMANHILNENRKRADATFVLVEAMFPSH